MLRPSWELESLRVPFCLTWEVTCLTNWISMLHGTQPRTMGNHACAQVHRKADDLRRAVKTCKATSAKDCAVTLG